MGYLNFSSYFQLCVEIILKMPILNLPPLFGISQSDYFWALLHKNVFFQEEHNFKTNSTTNKTETGQISAAFLDWFLFGETKFDLLMFHFLFQLNLCGNTHFQI